MRNILFGVLGLFALVIVALIAAPAFLPVATFKPQIEAEAGKALGREVSLGEDLSLSLFPRFRFETSGLSIANAPGMTAEHFATVEAAAIDVALLPLLGGNVEINRFVLTRPEINLEKAADGTVNWELGAPAENDAPADDQTGGGAGPGGDIRLGDVRLVDGALTYIDKVEDKTYTASAINIDLELKSLKSPLRLDGDLVFQEEPVSLDVKIDTPAALRDGKAADIEVKARLSDAELDFNAATAAGDTLSYSGNLNLEAPSVRSLMAWLGQPMTSKNGFERLEISGDVTGGAETLAFENAAFLFDKIKGDGAVRLDMSGARPKISGSVTVDSLDLRPYETPQPDQASGGEMPEWSTEQIDFSGLKDADLDFDIKAKSIYAAGFKIDDSDLGLEVKNGVLSADLRRLALYDGVGEGSLTLNGAARTPDITAVFKLDGLNAETFMTDAADLDRLVGAGALTLNLTARGASEAALMRTLNGTGNFLVKDGAIKGVNLAQVARTLQAFAGPSEEEASQEGEAESPAAEAETDGGPQTDFAELAASFAITNGTVRTDDIRLLNPFIRLNGGGTVNLPGQSVDLRLTPRIVASAEGQGGASDLAGLSAPLKITGGFNDPKIALDLESAAREKAQDVISDQLNRIFGGSEEEDGEAAEAEQAPGEALVEDALKSLFGGRNE